MSAKYYISFTSDLDKKCRIEFDIEGYEGDPIELDGDGCSILYDGSDLLDPIITSKASLSVNYHEQFLADTRDADDKEIPVTIYHGNEKWIGFLIADNRDETFDKTNYSIELTCVDPFSYIRGLQKDLFRDTSMFGRQSIESVIRGVFAYALDSLTIDVQNDTIPTGATGNIINSTYCYMQVFQDDNGLFINGYDIIEKIMNDLVMTAIFYNGVLVLRNNRYMINQPTTEIGLNENDDPIFWVGNTELISRTRGQKEASRSLDYPDPVSLLSNPNFYFYDETKEDKIRGWFQHALPWHNLTGIEYVGTGREKSPYGVRLKGIETGSYPEGKQVGAVWSTSIIDMPVSGVNDNHNYLLKVKYRYTRYPIVLDGDSNQKKVVLGLNIIATDLGGSGKVMVYHNEGKTGIGQYSVNQWEDVSSGETTVARIFWPADNTNDIQDVEISIPSVANYGFIGPVQFDVYLLPIGAFNGNDSIFPAGGGVSAYPDSVDFISVDLMVTRDGKAYYNGNAYIDKYSSEQYFYTSPLNFSLIGETKDMTIGRSYYLSGRDENGNDINKLDFLNRASLTYSDGTAIETFTQGVKTLPLIQYGANSELFFNRLPRYQIDATIRGDVNITNVISSEKVIVGKYLCVKDEYNLYSDTHDMTLQQLSGSDDENDLIENFLSTN